MLARNILGVVICGLAGLLGTTGCMAATPIPVGFASELTGPQADLGVAGRDGAQLAVEVINQAGGINGRPLELVVKNDQGKPKVARQVDAELVEQGVVAIVGHMTSGQTAAVFEQMNTARVILLSPTASSSQFSGQADYFFRLIPHTDLLGKALASHIYAQGVRRITVVYDLSNQAYTESFWRAVQAEFERLGGKVEQPFTFTSGQTDLRTLMTQVTFSKPEAVVFVSSAVDTALMAQYSRKEGTPISFFAAPWAQTNELLEKGGRAVEGMELEAIYDPHNPFPAFEVFEKQFQARYNRSPDFGAVYAYEAVQVLAQALRQTGGQTDGLPEAIKSVRDVTGVQGLISLDEFGDVKREVYMTRVENGQFEMIKAIAPTD